MSRSSSVNRYQTSSDNKRVIMAFLICTLIADTAILTSNSISADSSLIPTHLTLLSQAEHILSTKKESRYQHTTHVNETSGIYDFDCSGFIDYVLQQTSPASLAVIKYLPNRLNRPLAQDYYYHFAKLGSGDDGDGWYGILRPLDLLPGDLIAWLRSPSSDSDDTGHVMMVRSNPITNPNQPNEILVPIIDSTRSPHSLDSRVNGVTGIGTGTISIVMNATGGAVGFRWRDGESKVIEYTRISFGQLGPSQAYTANNTSPSTTIQLSSWSTNTKISGATLGTVALFTAVALILASAVIVKIRHTKLGRSGHPAQ